MRSRWGLCHLTGKAFEQLDPRLVFEHLELRRERWQADVKALRRPGQVPWRTTVAFGKASTVSRNRSSRSRPANWAVSRNVSSLVTATSGAVGFSRSAA